MNTPKKKTAAANTNRFQWQNFRPCFGPHDGKRDASVGASMRWWNSHGEHVVKGLVSLQHLYGTPLFRLTYNAIEIVAGGNNKQVHGALYFPYEATEDVDLVYERLESTNTLAHGLRLTFQPGNQDGLEKIQIIIPVSDNQHESAGIMFRDSLDAVLRVKDMDPRTPKKKDARTSRTKK